MDGEVEVPLPAAGAAAAGAESAGPEVAGLDGAPAGGAQATTRASPPENRTPLRKNRRRDNMQPWPPFEVNLQAGQCIALDQCCCWIGRSCSQMAEATVSNWLTSRTRSLTVNVPGLARHSILYLEPSTPIPSINTQCPPSGLDTVVVGVVGMVCTAGQACTS